MNFSTDNRIFGGRHFNNINSSNEVHANTPNDKTGAVHENINVGESSYNAGIADDSLQQAFDAGIANRSEDEVHRNIHSLNTKFNSILGSFRGKPVMFDIYALMNIMQEMAQKMRDSLRELRNMENQTIQTNIRAQAAIQRNAAMQSMVAGAVLCGIQMTIAAVTTGVSIKNLAKQSAMMKSGGVDIMTKQNNLANTIGNETATKNMVKSITSQYSDTEITLEGIEMAESPDPAACESAEKALNKATAKLNNLGEIRKLQEQARPLSTNDQNRLNELCNKEGLNPDEKVTDEALNKAADDTRSATIELDRARGGDILKQNEKVVETAANEYKAARAKANDEISQKGKVSDGTQTELRNAEAKLLLSRGKQIMIANKLIKSGNINYNDTINSIKLDSSKMLSEAHEGSITKADQINFGKLQARLSLAMSANQAFGQLGQSIISGIKELVSASATELQADQKMQEDQLDQLKDLFAQELSVIQKVFQLFEAITQKESSTIENIIMA